MRRDFPKLAPVTRLPGGVGAKGSHKKVVARDREKYSPAWLPDRGRRGEFDPAAAPNFLLMVTAVSAGRGARGDCVLCCVKVQRVFDETVIAEAGRRLSEAAPPGTRVILFGSHARGHAGKYSDLDFLVIEPFVDDLIDESVRLRRTLRGLGVFADVIVVSEGEAETSANFQGSLIYDALNQGRELAA
jgi:predicted nucleotidyltransferase